MAAGRAPPIGGLGLEDGVDLHLLVPPQGREGVHGSEGPLLLLGTAHLQCNREHGVLLRQWEEERLIPDQVVNGTRGGEPHEVATPDLTIYQRPGVHGLGQVRGLQHLQLNPLLLHPRDGGLPGVVLRGLCGQQEHEDGLLIALLSLAAQGDPEILQFVLCEVGDDGGSGGGAQGKVKAVWGPELTQAEVQHVVLLWHLVPQDGVPRQGRAGGGCALGLAIDGHFHIQVGTVRAWGQAEWLAADDMEIELRGLDVRHCGAHLGAVTEVWARARMIWDW
mmetsp:Transcript_81902/g.144600  ORF Transcript_81902/g.144600 Transcript_81902/m.144600 type:complete len:278 (+) Transcript_81902:3807-4640(+)